MVFFSNNEFSLSDGKNNIKPPTLAELEESILEKFDSMSIDDLVDTQISQYEYRKIIGIKYQNINLTQEEIQALALYKHGYFTKVNGFLRGDLKAITDIQGKTISEEELVNDELSKIIDCIGIIVELQKKFITARDMTLVRRDSRIREDMPKKLEYDNFISTSANPRLFTYKLDGIGKGGFVFIKVPKGTSVIPMDIVTEKQMKLNSSVNSFGGGDIGYEESEMLMPMCDIEVNNQILAQDGIIMVEATMLRQKDPIDIMNKRLEEMSNIIVQYGGQEKLEELKAKVEAIKSKVIAKKKFTEQEIGEATINRQTSRKDKAQSQEKLEELKAKKDESQLD